MERFVKRPRKGERIEINVGTVTIVHVFKDGVELEVEDRHGQRSIVARDRTNGHWTRSEH